MILCLLYCTVHRSNLYLSSIVLHCSKPLCLFQLYKDVVPLFKHCTAVLHLTKQYSAVQIQPSTSTVLLSSTNPTLHQNCTAQQYRSNHPPAQHCSAVHIQPSTSTVLQYCTTVLLSSTDQTLHQRSTAVQYHSTAQPSFKHLV